jgi:hypothetical protein
MIQYQAEPFEMGNYPGLVQPILKCLLPFKTKEIHTMFEKKIVHINSCRMPQVMGVPPKTFKAKYK